MMINIRLTKDFFLFLKEADAQSTERLSALWDEYYSDYIEAFSEKWVIYYILYSKGSTIILELKSAYDEMREVCHLVKENIDFILEYDARNIHADKNALRYRDAVSYYFDLLNFVEYDWPCQSFREKEIENKYEEYLKFVEKRDKKKAIKTPIRTPIQILDQVRDVLPSYIVGQYDKQFDSIRDSLGYSSPESNLHVERLMDLFNDIVGSPPYNEKTEGWKIKAIATYMGESEEQTRKNLALNDAEK